MNTSQRQLSSAAWLLWYIIYTSEQNLLSTQGLPFMIRPFVAFDPARRTRYLTELKLQPGLEGCKPEFRSLSYRWKTALEMAGWAPCTAIMTVYAMCLMIPQGLLFYQSLKTNDFALLQRPRAHVTHQSRQMTAQSRPL